MNPLTCCIKKENGGLTLLYFFALEIQTPWLFYYFSLPISFILTICSQNRSDSNAIPGLSKSSSSFTPEHLVSCITSCSLDANSSEMFFHRP